MNRVNAYPMIAPPQSNALLQARTVHDPEVAMELDRLWITVHEVGALAERAVVMQGPAVTLAWLRRLSNEMERELCWCGSLPQCAAAPGPVPRRRRHDLGTDPGWTPSDEPRTGAECHGGPR